MKRILIFAFTLLLVSCGKKIIFENERIFENNTWNRFAKVNFEFPVDKAGGYYHIKLIIKQDGNFEADGLPVYLILNTSSGEERMKEANFLLKDKGMLQGEKQGNLYVITKDIWKTILIDEKGKCNISIENIYPKFDSYGIHSVGLIVEKSEKPEPQEEE